MQTHLQVREFGARRERRFALAAAVCLAAAALVQPAHAADSGTSPGPAHPFVTPIGVEAPAARQHVAASADEIGTEPRDVLPLVADTIHSLGRDDGFAGQKLDPFSGSIDVYWKGPVSPKVTSHVAMHNKGAKVRFHETAVFTRVQAQQVASRVTGNDALVESAGIAAVAVNHDGTGIRVKVEGATPNADLKRQIARTAGVNAKYVAYAEHVGKRVNLATRPNDTAPWKGGIRTVQNGNNCSTGFAVLAGSEGVLLSANHCDPTANHSVTDGAGTTIATGAGVNGNANIDSQSINPSASPSTTPLVYTGAWNSSTTATVKSWATNWTGQTVCSSGATTGTHCGTITNDALSYPGLTGSWYVEARGTGAYMAGGGDSGGALYATVTGGVQARGTLIGGWTASETFCGAHNPDVTTTCFRDIVYVPISVVLSTWGYTLEVG
ncbi:hypothetical protein ACWF94_35135 [Streptomyces sp. NPDC055078]